MRKLVIIPGGFHPFHAGHKALYDAARQAFPSADIYVAASADTSTRPFSFPIKEKLARLAGIPAHRFIQVKSPFRAEEITQHFDPNDTQLIFVRSEKDRNEQPKPGGVRKDGKPAYLQPYKRNGLQPMSQHGYMAYLPVVQFGSGMTSATEIRAKWPSMTPEQKSALVQSLYPITVGNQKLIDITAKLLDAGMSSEKPAPVKEVDEATLVNDPQAGIQIRPTGGLGTWDENTLKSSLAKQLSELVEMLKVGNYRGVEHLLYKAGAMQSKVQALARLEDFNQKQGQRPIAKGREIDIGENTDYVDEN
jgi:glycerol-3-phosphate cytidylyltransferase-like family protein